MIRIRLGFALTMLAASAGFLQAAPIHAPQAEVIDRLAAALATHDPARITMAYRAMGDYGMPAAHIVESSVNAMGYRHLEHSEIDAAIAVFELNIDTFPESANTWDSLAEATLAKGDREMALRYYRRSLDLDPENRNAAHMIQRMTGEQQLTHASD